MDNLMKLYYESMVTQKEIWTSLLGAVDNGRKKMKKYNTAMWAVVYGPQNSWEILHCGKSQGFIDRSIPIDVAINYWLNINEGDWSTEEEYEELDCSLEFAEYHNKHKDDVNSPEHYTVGGFEAIDVIKAKLTKEEWIGYCKGNVLKYMMRSNYKGSHDNDVGKAEYYVCSMMETIEDGQANYDLTDPPF